MSTDDTTDDDPDLTRTREEKLKALCRREDIRDETRRAAEDALQRLQEGSL